MNSKAIDAVLTFAKNGDKIELIKLFRQETGKGLKDSKDAIESCENHPFNSSAYPGTSGHRFDNDKLLDLFYKATDGNFKYKRQGEYEYAYCDKDSFMDMISKAIDAGKALKCTDMLEAVMLLCENIQAQGGLHEIARRRAEFVDKL